MKKTFTTLILMTFGLFMLSTGVIAQQYDVPGTYATVKAAFDQINTDVTADPNITEVTISVAEGTVIETTYSNGVIHPILVTIEGAGADLTAIESFRGARAIPGEADALSTRFIELTSVDGDSAEYVIQDLTLRFFGRGDNDNGGVFSTSSTKAGYIKFSVINVVFDSCCAKQGAIWHGANATHEFLMDNCLVTGCMTYGGSAFAGPIAVDNGGLVTITNSTFIGNERYPWDHRANPATPIDKGAGRGGVIKVKDGINKMVDPNVFSPLLFTMENNAFIDNMPLVEAIDEMGVPSDSIHPAVEISTSDTILNEISLVDNIFVGNSRPGYETTDVDFMLETSREFVTWESTGNIVNSIVNKGTYTDTLVDGFKVDPNYTYTHACIDFTMDGDFPALVVDGDAIGHVEYSGDGGTPLAILVTSVTLSAESNSVDPPATLQISASIEPVDATATDLVWTVEDGTGSATIDQTGLLTPTKSGTVTVKATAPDCGEAQGTLEITITGTLGIDNDLQSEINVYPNPSNGQFEVALPEQMQSATYEVLSITGSLIKSGILTDSHSRLDLTDNAKGLYILKINGEDQSSIKRLIVE